MTTPPNDPYRSDIFDDTRQTFHDLRGRLTEILDAVRIIRQEPVSAAQEEQLQRMDAVVDELARAITRIGDRLLDSLALTPASRLIWQTPCLRDLTIDQAILDQTLAEMREQYPLHPFKTVILVADRELLPLLRTTFSKMGCRVRLAGQPDDVLYLLEAEEAELIAMAPPPESEIPWWRQLRKLLQNSRHQPMLMHLGRIAPSP
jgi:hypothetical protein